MGTMCARDFGDLPVVPEVKAGDRLTFKMLDGRAVFSDQTGTPLPVPVGMSVDMYGFNERDRHIHGVDSRENGVVWMGSAFSLGYRTERQLVNAAMLTSTEIVVIVQSVPQ